MLCAGVCPGPLLPTNASAEDALQGPSFFHIDMIEVLPWLVVALHLHRVFVL